jgi:hypothetical protein
MDPPFGTVAVTSHLMAFGFEYDEVFKIQFVVTVAVTGPASVSAPFFTVAALVNVD